MVLLVNIMWTEVSYTTLMPEYQNIIFFNCLTHCHHPHMAGLLNDDVEQSIYPHHCEFYEVKLIN